ncbi:MAG: MFS transporter [Eubacteriales bacterium]|nr:MFS transporter [Eubacteriales bacterium]
MEKMRRGEARRIAAMYVLLHLAFWATWLYVGAYTANFILGLGFEKSETGILMAVASLAAATIQNFLASLADRYEKTPLASFLITFALIALVSSCALYFFPQWPRLISGLLFAAVLIVVFMIQPFLPALALRLQAAGLPVHFGLARGLGSGVFAANAFIAGVFLLHNPIRSFALLWTLPLFIFLLISLYFHRVELRLQQVRLQIELADNRPGLASLSTFAHRYPYYMYFLVGTVLLFLAFNLFYSFAIVHIRSVGGDEGMMGLVLALAAGTEAIFMPLYAYLRRRYHLNSVRCLQFAAFGFVLKAGLQAFLNTPAGMTYSQLTQALGYAIYTPAYVDYTGECMASEDQVKGQSLVATAIVISNVLAAFIGGLWLSSYSAQSLRLLAFGLALLGTSIVAYTAPKTAAHPSLAALRFDV